MKIIENKKYLLKLLTLLFIFLLPWLVFGLNSDVEPEKITSDLRFYEINTCSISLIDFLQENPNVIYQDHYKIRVNNYSSMRCFGTLTGVDQINHVFYISVGTNSFINLLLQSLFWFFIILFIKKTKDFYISIGDIFSVILATLIFVLTIYAEERFYVKNLYFYDFESSRYFLQLYFLIFFICSLSFYILNTRLHSLGNYLPFLYLVIGLFSGLNFNFFAAGLTAIGFKRLIIDKKLWVNKYIIFTFIFIWTNNAYNKEFYVDPDKIRGFTSTIFTSFSIFLYSLIFVFLINGLVFIFNHNNNFKIEKYLSNLMYTSLAILTLGLASSSFPLFNFLNYYYLGGNKVGIERSNIFQVNEWGERLSWRGQYPSAETIGEFFGMCIFIYLFLLFNKNIKIEKAQFLLLLVSILGLFLSNNRAALFATLTCLFILFFKKNRDRKFSKYFAGISLFIFFLILIGSSNLVFTYDYLKESLINDAIFYSLNDTFSSSLNYINSLEDTSIVLKVISLVSVFGFFVNRSELWGIFIARYNPDVQEFLFGTGFFNFGQLYGDVNINPTYSFLLPHSSLLSILLFMGFINTLVLLVIVLKKFISKNEIFDSIFPYLSLFVFMNLLKSDSILYFSAFVNYLFVFMNTNKSNKISNSTNNKVRY